MSVIKKSLKVLVPYGLVRLREMSIAKRAVAERERKQSLFDGDDWLFKRVLAESKLYGEYGCGDSTKWVLKNSNANVLSVDTSKDWIEKVKAAAPGSEERLCMEHVDLGELANWGRPVGYERRASIPRYTDFLWSTDRLPDTVLIDGRFRVCCFLTCLSKAKAGTRLLFDDYTIRPQYHVVESYVSRKEECGRQCLFEVPSKSEIDVERLERDIEAFRLVMD